MEERTVYTGEYVGKKYKVGTLFTYGVSVPAKDRRGGCALLVNHDGLRDCEVEAMAKLHHSKKAPACIVVGIGSGRLPASVDGSYDRGMRADNYDMRDREYADFVVNELLPFLINEYHLHVSKSPDLHAVSGGSSGGISAWQIAWYHPEYFHRVYMSSPSMLAMGRGDEWPNLIRKCETKPIKIWTEYSEKEVDDYFGESAPVCEALFRSLKVAGYEVQGAYFAGEGHCSKYGNAEHLCEVYAWLWANLDVPVTVKRNTARVDAVVPFGSKWEKTTENFPLKIAMNVKSPVGSYVTRGSQIVLLHKGGAEIVEKGLKVPTALAVSSDGGMLYYADKNSGVIAAYQILKDGMLGARKIHGMLHEKGDFDIPGALDICVDREDRVYAATEMGIQCIRSFGLIDVILDNPDGLQVKRLAFAPDGSSVLYAETARGVYKRTLAVGALPEGQYSQPCHTSYFD